MPPVIVLVGTQLAMNIGMCARAMLNCGLTELRLVAPRDGWPNPDALAPSAGAESLINAAQSFPDIDSALADCTRVLATSARGRELSIPSLSLPEAISDISSHSGTGRTAVLFGPEASGLDNEVLSRADRLINYRMNPDYTSLNLAQAVLLFGWEWWSAEGSPEEVTESDDLATKEGLEHFLNRLIVELDSGGFFPNEEKKPSTTRQLRTYFNRSRPTDRELRSLHGIISALTKSH